MTEASDWEPLLEEHRVSHPGEFVAAAEPAVVPAPAARAAVPAPAPDPAAVAALQHLQRRLAAAKPATSLVAAVQRREQRLERRLAAAHAAFAEQAKVVQSSLTGPQDVPLPVEFADREADRDPREHEPWFLALPTPDRERLRAYWWHERHRHDGKGVRIRRRVGRAVLHGALVFFVLGLLQILLHGGFAMVPVLTAAGALGAGVAELCGGGRIVYSLAGAGVFVVVLGPMVMLQPLGMVSLMLTTYTMGALGMDGEMQRSGGFDVA